MSELQNQKIITIIITFFPEAKSLNKAISSISQQCDSIFVIDNTPTPLNNNTAELLKDSVVKLISLGDNFGIAYAQNVGIEAAMNANADFVLIMDQDSIPEQNMIDKLIGVLNEKNDANVIAVGPTYTDPRTQVTSYFLTSRLGLLFRYKPKKNSDPNIPIQVAFLISSGTLISLPKLLTIGGMRSNYFIDHVDTEWCFRAASKGFTLLGLPSAEMEHSLGDKVKRVWLFYLRSVSLHSPLRDYYMYRNTILMLRDIKIPFFWKCFTVYRLLPFAVYFLVFTSNRFVRARAMLLGLKHGFQNRSGKVNLESGTCTPIPKTALDPS
jgi:rhamnosyltransferase